MAFVDELRGWFERDLRSASWDENVKVDDTDPSRVEMRLYTDTNEYTLTILVEGDGPPWVDATVASRKARAGENRARVRRLLAPGRNHLNERVWRRILAGIVGIELVRVHRRAAPEAADERAADKPAPAFALTREPAGASAASG